MTIIYVNTCVDVEIDLDKVSAIDLAKALVKKTDYLNALEKVTGGKVFADCIDADEDDSLRILVMAYKYGKPIAPLLSDIAYSHYGLVC